MPVKLYSLCTFYRYYFNSTYQSILILEKNLFLNINVIYSFLLFSLLIDMYELLCTYTSNQIFDKKKNTKHF